VISNFGIAAQFDKIPISPQIATPDAEASGSKRSASSLVGGFCCGADPEGRY
jgi:hypothetical protein